MPTDNCQKPTSSATPAHLQIGLQWLPAVQDQTQDRKGAGVTNIKRTEIKPMPGVRGTPKTTEPYCGCEWDNELGGWVEQGQIHGPHRIRRRDAVRAWNKLVDDITKAAKEQA